VLVQAQLKSKAKKYPSLFWEITGNGLKKPSYLFGTMHVSSKIAFNLSDSFYIAIKNSEVVALETNPETWQEDMNNYDLESSSSNDGYGGSSSFSEMPDDYLTEKTLRIPKYENKLEMAMFSKPSVINNLLYRTMSDNNSDFEEDTYLDLYIYQTGKKLGKKVAGVEQYEESMRLMNEAYRDAAKEKNKKEKSFDYDEEYAPTKLQEAYRLGNLDLLDSINRLNSQSEAFDEKFLYRRNEIQAHSIDSILKRNSLFVGVGAAHLPGERGVIELLRKKGYRLRPIFMGSRDSKQKDAVENVRVPVAFTTQTAQDGFFKVDIPGKFYHFGDNSFFDQEQYADMANGSFYMVTRVKTNSLYWGHNTDMVAKKIDSLLYENVPGKILSKKEITKNGYKGFDISSRTRRGDFNRYNIFITPFEVIFFKMGGNSDYAKDGDEAKKFFSSIQLKEFKNSGWKKFQPSYGGFSIDFPQEPYFSFDDNIQYDAEDKTTGQHFSVLRTDIHNYDFVEEDTFDLSLMDESFASSEFIEKNISRKQFVYKGYPTLDCKYRLQDGSFISTRFIIQGPHYYTLIAHGKDNLQPDNFFNSFEITPFVYSDVKERKDSTLGFTVSTNWYLPEKKNKIDLPNQYSYKEDDDDDDNYYSLFQKDSYKSKLIQNDTTGEAIFISFMRLSKYQKLDSLEVNKSKYRLYDSLWIVRSKKEYESKNGMKVIDMVVSDTNSSRAIHVKSVYNDGLAFALITEMDTLTQPSPFIKSFYDSFLPADTLKFINPYTKKSKIFFDDFFSNDSIIRKKAVNSIVQIELDSTDLPQLTKAINSFQWSEKNYLDRKISFINKLSVIPVKASSDLLKEMYYSAGDTIKLQHAALETLLKQQTQYAYNLFRDIMTNDPPIIGTGNAYISSMPNYISSYSKSRRSSYSNGSFMDELKDSLLLTKSILPSLLPLINLDDYKRPIMYLLRTMVDSNMVKTKDYEIYMSKFLIEARQELKRQAILEKESAIKKAEDEKKEVKTSSLYRSNDEDKGNEDLITYATLLLPFRETNSGVNDLLKKMISSNDKRLKYNTVYLFIRHKIPVADSTLTFFAGTDDYRYELFSDMKEYKMLDRFPKAYKNEKDIAKSKLYSSATDKPDSLLFINSLPVELNDSKGVMFFYKYKSKKDDLFWKLATVSLLSEDGNIFKYEKRSKKAETFYLSSLYSNDDNDGKAEFTDEKIKEEISIKEQMEKQMKKLIYSKRKSAAMFYDDESDYADPSRRLLD
jgi:uncharacterized protein YbaP (TraB family)